MKRLTAFLAAVTAAALCSVCAYADVIWEPESDFFFEHSEECERVEYTYEARTDTHLFQSPEDPTVLEDIAAGETRYTEYIWHGDSADWAVDCRTGDGWMNLSDFRRLYGPSDFEADHGEEITAGTGAVSRETYPEIRLWTFPGSGQTDGEISAADFGWAEDDPVYDAVFTDENGGTWVRIPYYYGLRGWIFRDDPAAELSSASPHYADEDTQAAEDVSASPNRLQVTPQPRYATREEAGLGPVVSAVMIVIIAAAVLVLVLPFGKMKSRKK